MMIRLTKDRASRKDREGGGGWKIITDDAFSPFMTNEHETLTKLVQRTSSVHNMQNMREEEYGLKQEDEG